MTGYQVGAHYVFGASGQPDDLTIHSIEIEGSIQVFSDSRVTIRLPWSGTSGPLGNASGIGDLVVILDQEVGAMSGGRLDVQIGGKFATGEVNSGNLPQAYQPGLGTNDLLVGVSYETTPWLFALGYQLSQGRSDNAVTRLKRGDDLLGRIGYMTTFDKLSVGLEALAIKRLQESSVLDTTIAGVESFADVPDSDQLQVNLVGRVSLPLSETFGLQGLVALPLLSRDVNVDGLKRSITISAGVEYSF